MIRWLALIVALGVAIAGADLSGSWTLELNPDFSGHESAVDCTFAQDGGKLVVTCDGPPIDGEINGDQVTLRFKTGDRGDVAATLTGTLDPDGTIVTGTWHLSEPEARDGRFTARRIKK